MKRSSTVLILMGVAISGYTQGDSPTLSVNNSFSSINIRANTTAVPVLRFTRWMGAAQLQNNAYVGQYYNTTLNEYSFGIGTGLSTTGNQDASNTILTATISGKIGIGTTTPSAKFDVGSDISGGTLGTVFGRLPEGNGSGDGTFLGVRGYTTQPVDAKSFAIEHSFYGTVNSSINFNRGGGITGGFMAFNTGTNTEQMRITTAGNVGIGTTNPDAKLAVNGTIHTKEVKVDLTGWPDYVFNDDYKLLSLAEIKTYIDKNNHLPGVPSAKEIEPMVLTWAR